MNISYLGQKGSFHDIVSRKFFKAEFSPLERDSFDLVFKDVKDGKADFGVVAIENSIAGSILGNFDLLMEYDLKIVGEAYLRIVHNLLTLPGQSLKDIKEVYSHPMALKQCKEFLEKHDWMKRVEFEDTAGSARKVASDEKKGVAAIASKLAAEIYGLEILAESIETNKENYTRFLVIAKDEKALESKKPDNKVSLVFQTAHVPGSLYKCLGCFAERDMNLSKIESRPIIGKKWEYYFYMDFENGIQEKVTREALKELEKYTSMIKVLGSYVRGEVYE